MRLAGGLAIALAAATALAGPDVAIAAVIAVVLAFFATLVPESDNFPGWEIDRVLLSLAIVGLPLVAAYASTFAAYVVPGHPRIAGVGLVLLAAYLDNGGVWIAPRLRTVVLWTLAFGVFVLVIASVGAPPDHVPHGDPGSRWEIATAALVLVPVLVPAPGPSRLGRFTLITLLAGITGIGVAHQLGTELSPTFLRDLLVAVELGPLGAALVVLVGVATVTAAVDTFADAQLDVLSGGWSLAAGTLATAAVAAFVPPVVIMILAGVGAVVNAAFWYSIAFSSYRR